MSYMKSSDGVRLDSVPIAMNTNDPGLDLWLLWGQSNMAGKATGFSTTGQDPLEPRVLCYASTGGNAGAIAIASDPLGHPDSSTGMGPGLPFARWQVLRTPANRRILLVPSAWSGSGFSFDTTTSPRTWLVGDTTTGIFNLFENAIAQATAALAAAGGNARIAGILWHQGEHDAGQASYQTWLDALIAAARTRLGLPNLPFILGQQVSERIAATPAAAVIDAIHLDTPRRVLNTAFAYAPPVGNELGDDLHFNAAGQRILGKNYFEVLPLATANTAASVPTPPLSATFDAYSNQLVMTWKRPICRFTDFHIQYRVTGTSTWTQLTRAQSINRTATITGLTAPVSYDVQVQTVNENGVSAWSSTFTATTAVAPGQVAGLVLSNATQTSQLLKWNALTGATAYTIEYKRSIDSSWTTAATGVTTTSGTVVGLSAAISYDYRVTGTNRAGSGTASAIATGLTLTAPACLGVTAIPAARAYSASRYIVSTYQGPLIRVQRSSDGTQTDFTVSATTNVLDTAALLAFVGSGNGYVAKWYDQSGNGRDIAQPTTAAMFGIVTGGVVNIQGPNSRPELRDVSSSYLFDTVPGMAASTVGASAAMVHRITTASTSRWMVAEGGTTSTLANYAIFASSSAAAGSASQVYRTTAGSYILSNTENLTPAAFVAGSQKQLCAVDTTTGWRKFVDATELTPALSYSTTRLSGFDRFSIGAALRSDGVGGVAVTGGGGSNFAELVIWYGPLADADRITAQSNQKAFFGTA